MSRNVDDGWGDLFTPKFSGLSTERASAIANHFNKSEFRKFFADLEGQKVIELGPGMRPHGYNMAMLSKASSYVGVDPNYAETLKKNLDYFIDHYRGIPETIPYRDEVGDVPVIPYEVVGQDALTYLESLQSGSVKALLISGLDDFVITHDTYAKAVAKEIERVLHPDGVYIEWDSVFGAYLDSEFARETAAETPAGEHLGRAAGQLVKYRRKKQ